MFSVAEAQQRILTAFSPLEVEHIPLEDALGRVVAEDTMAQDQLPLFDNSAMDGYALRGHDTQEAMRERPLRLRIIGEIPAGRVLDDALKEGGAARIFTGAAVPDGADAVIEQELVSVVDGYLIVEAPVAPGTNVRRAGEDVAKGERLLPVGVEIGPAELALLASAGVSPIAVRRRPRVAILATGDELVPPGEPLAPGQIRESNSIYLTAAVTRAGATAIPLGVARDDEDDLRDKLVSAQDADVILSSGGVSVGDYDLVKQILGEQGAVDFWRVRMRPGKPLAFGRLGDTSLIGLPGNPVSAAVTFELFARPAIRRMLGAASVFRPRVEAILDGPDIARSDREHYVRVRLYAQEGVLCARPTGDQRSHIITSLRGASAYLVIAIGEGVVRSGERVPALLLNDGLPWGDE
jgi:molybdopterin molybdotransferase